jgi:hypothetical protein
LASISRLARAIVPAASVALAETWASGERARDRPTIIVVRACRMTIHFLLGWRMSQSMRKVIEARPIFC